MNKVKQEIFFLATYEKTPRVRRVRKFPQAIRSFEWLPKQNSKAIFDKIEKLLLF